MAPVFARAIHDVAAPYLEWVKMPQNYHFADNRPAGPSVVLEIRLKDADGQPLASRRLPDPSPNFWVRRREALLAQRLTEDRPVQPMPGESIPPPDQPARTVTIWEIARPHHLTMRAVAEHLVPRDRPVFAPSPLALVLSRSYARHLCRVHGAAAAEIVRYSREPIPPAALFQKEPPADALEELVSDFGVLSP
jgi:hypothetical protein